MRRVFARKKSVLLKIFSILKRCKPLSGKSEQIKGSQPRRLPIHRIHFLQKRSLAHPPIQNREHSNQRIFSAKTFLYFLISIAGKRLAKLIIGMRRAILHANAIQKWPKFIPILRFSIRSRGFLPSAFQKIGVDRFHGAAFCQRAVYPNFKNTVAVHAGIGRTAVLHPPPQSESQHIPFQIPAHSTPGRQCFFHKAL